jgi:hypothetical protein
MLTLAVLGVVLTTIQTALTYLMYRSSDRK